MYEIWSTFFTVLVFALCAAVVADHWNKKSDVSGLKERCKLDDDITEEDRKKIKEAEKALQAHEKYVKLVVALFIVSLMITLILFLEKAKKDDKNGGGDDVSPSPTESTAPTTMNETTPTGAVTPTPTAALVSTTTPTNIPTPANTPTPLPTLTATPTEAPNVTVSYNGNGGRVDVASRNVVFGSVYGELPMPNKDGFRFEGWYSAIDGGVKIESSTTVSTTQNHTIYAHWTENAWGNWTTDSSKVNDPLYISESKTQYRYRDKSTKTSTNAIESGWTRDDSGTKTETVYGNWDTWSAWTPSDNPPTKSDVMDVQTATVYGYYYYLCPNCNNHVHGWGECYVWAEGCGAYIDQYTAWRQIWSDIAWDNAGLKDWHGTGRFYTDCVSDPNYGGGRYFKYPEKDGSPRWGYRYRERTKKQSATYSFYKWSEWSAWQDGYINEADNRNVEKRTVFRYKER